MDPATLAFHGLLLIYALAFGIPLIHARLAHRQRQKERRKGGVYSLTRLFRSAGRQLRLDLVQKDTAQGPQLRGRIDGLEVIARCTPSPQDSWATGASVQLTLPLLREIYVQSRWRPPTSTLHDTALTGAADIGIGDAAFDALMEAGGHAPVARTHLTAGVRGALTALARRGVVRIDDGCLAYELLERLWFPDALVSLIREVLAAAAAFPHVSDVSVALVDVARSDPLPGVRARCLATLLAEQRDEARTAQALDAALSDVSDVVRIVAATALGERGISVLREIATCDCREEEPAARAITLLGRRLGSPETTAILDGAIASRRHIVAASAIESLGRSGDPAACPRFPDLLRGEEESLALAAANALGAMPPATATPILIDALRSPSLAVRHAVVHALANVGNLAALAPLHALLGSGACDPVLAAAVRQVIAAIQARIPGASPGQVSLADDASGELSIADETEAGRLSVAEDRSLRQHP